MDGDITQKVIVETTKAVAKEMYNDGFKPFVSQVGKALETVTGLLNVILYPLEKLRIITDSKRKEFIEELMEGAENIPKEKLMPPPANIVGPTLEGLKYTIDINELKAMFKQLLLSAMDKDVINKVHPSYVEIIKH
jgi:hypothetical protein